MRKKGILLVLGILLTCITCKVGYASWNFSDSDDTVLNANTSIGLFNFDPDFNNKDCLDNKTLKYVYNLKDAFNDKNSSLYSAFKYLKYGWYVGNMDDNYHPRNYLNKALGSYDSSFMIFRNNDGTYYLYITYKNLDNYHYWTEVKPVYRITYKKVDNVWYPVNAEKGSALVTNYDLLGGEHQKALAMTTFEAN